MKLTKEQRQNLEAKVKKHSMKRKRSHSLGDKKRASFHEGAMKMAQQILEEFI